MEEQEYRSIYSLEDRHWWYVALRHFVHYSIGRHLKERGLSGGWGSAVRVLDAGCGTGALLSGLQRNCRAVGIDFSELALGLCRERGAGSLVRGSVSTLPFGDRTFDLVVSLDVLYHDFVEDDIAALKEFRRVLKDGGALILNLPAYWFLRSPHDRAVHTRRRYTRRMLARKLTEAGFTVDRITYRNVFLFPSIVLYRVFKRFLSKKGDYDTSDSDLAETRPWVNWLLLQVLSLENNLLRKVNLPFGTSVYCVARRSS
jgi:SAM-dependent methyltransferase